MLTQFKLFGKNILRVLNTASGRLLPVVDLRTGAETDVPEKTILTGPFTIKGEALSYHYETNGKTPYWIGLLSNGVTIPPGFILIMKNARMAGRGVIIYNHKVILESAIFQLEYLNKLMANHVVFKTLFAKPGRTIRNAIPLLNKLSNNYYHWTTESLTRLAMLSEYSKENYHDYDIVVAADAPGFVKESLIDLFGVKESKIIAWKNYDACSIENCIVISYPFIRTEETAMTNIYNLPLYALLNKLSLKAIPSLTNTPEYIIISRANVNQRKLKGEEKIVQAFATIPFKIIYTERMTYSEQVRMFRNAKIVIAPHGAGLINLVYVQQNPVVIEFFPSNRKIRDAGAYHQVAREMRINYHLLVKDAINDEQDIEITDNILFELKNIISLYYNQGF